MDRDSWGRGLPFEDWPAQDRAMLALRYREGMTQGQVAEAMGMPEGTVKVRLHRARAALKRILLPKLRGGQA